MTRTPIRVTKATEPVIAISLAALTTPPVWVDAASKLALDDKPRPAIAIPTHPHLGRALSRCPFAERAALQTAEIARRLMRGGELHQDVRPS
jgi:hypothetical protein